VNVLDEIVQDQLRTDIPELAPGDTVKVAAKVVEGTRERIQVFEGTILRLTGGGITRSVTVRRIASGVGVERTFKVNSPRIEKIEVVRHGVARASSTSCASGSARRPRSASAARLGPGPRRPAPATLRPRQATGPQRFRVPCPAMASPVPRSGSGAPVARRAARVAADGLAWPPSGQSSPRP
jgi:large subunit ribosomal protein L19